MTAQTTVPMAQTEYDIENLEELYAVFNQLPVKMEKTILRKTLRRTMTPILQAARREAPARTGKLRKSLKLTARKARGGRVSMAVRPVFDYYTSGKINSFYGLIIHQGRKANPNPKPHRYVRNGQIFFTGKIGAIKANPYLERAWKEAAGNYEKSFSDNLRINLEKEIRKANG